MSIEEELTIYLRCDATDVEWSQDGRCTVTFGRMKRWPDTWDAVDAIVRQARAAAWHVTIKDEGLKGYHVTALCPDHDPEPLEIPS